MRKKKVAIFTFCHRDYPVNYGQTLQGFALYKVIKSLNYKVTVVSHKNRSAEQKKGYIKEYYFPQRDSIESRSFAKFTRFVRKNMNCIQSYDFSTATRIAQKNDILVCGSDAIWRTMHFDPAYYLNFEGCENKLKLSYAASFVNFIEKDIDIYKKMGEMINKIHYISTREKDGEKLLREVCGCRQVKTVLDPTLLYGRSNWEKYIPNMELPSSYIILYLFDDTNEYDKLISEIKNKCQAETVYTIFTGTRLNNRKYIEEGVGPDEFIAWIRGAKGVVTNSFHGTAFSIMFEREIFILKRFNESLENDFRFKNIVSICNLDSRLIDSTVNINQLDKIDYESVNEKLESERINSMQFLEEALHDKEKKVCMESKRKM